MLNFCARDLMNKEDKEIFFDIDEYIDLNTDDVSSVGNAVGNIDFELRNDFLIATGEIKNSVKLICYRCLKSYTIDLDLYIDEAIEVKDDQVHTSDVEYDMENFHEQITSTEHVNVKDLIRQYVILNLPTRRVCSEDCVNERVEDVNKRERDSMDPRWEKLASFSYDNNDNRNEGE